MVIPRNREPEVYPIVLEIGRPIANPVCRLGMNMGHFRLSPLFPLASATSRHRPIRRWNHVLIIDTHSP